MMFINKTMNTEMTVNDVVSVNTTCMGCGGSGVHYYLGRIAGRKKSWILCDKCVSLLEQKLKETEMLILKLTRGGIVHEETISVNSEAPQEGESNDNKNETKE